MYPMVWGYSDPLQNILKAIDLENNVRSSFVNDVLESEHWKLCRICGEGT